MDYVVGGIVMAIVAFAAIRSRFSAFAAILLLAPFQGLSVVTFGGNSLQAFNFAIAAYLARVLFDYLSRKMAIEIDREIRVIVWVLVMLLGWGWLISFAGPRAFAGIEVYSAREGLTSQIYFRSRLEPSTSNLAQSLYLTLDVLLVLSAVCLTPSLRSHQIVRAMMLAGFLILGVSALSMIPAIENLFTQVFYTFSRNAEVRQYQFAGSRVFIPFVEPSQAGMFYAGIYAFSLCRTLLRPSWWSLAIVVGSGTMTMYVQSSLGVGTVGLMTGLVPCIALFSVDQRRRGMMIVRLALFACGGVLVLFLFHERILETWERVYTMKLGGTSFAVRDYSNQDAVEVLKDTAYLGAGMGSNRVSSLFYMLISNVGLLGTAMFFGLLIAPLVLAFRRRSFLSPFAEAFAFLTAVSIACMLGVPDLGFPFIWCGLIWSIVAARESKRAPDKIISHPKTSAIGRSASHSHRLPVS